MAEIEGSLEFNEQDYIDRLKEREELIRKIEEFLKNENIEIEKNQSE